MTQGEIFATGYDTMGEKRVQPSFPEFWIRSISKIRGYKKCAFTGHLTPMAEKLGAVEF